MRYLISMPLLGIGVVLLGVAVVAYMQLRAMATEVQAPKMGDYPAVNLVASDLWNAAIAPKKGPAPHPAELAMQTMRRIKMIGFAGLITAAVGLLTLAIWPKARRREGS